MPSSEPEFGRAKAEGPLRAWGEEPGKPGAARHKAGPYSLRRCSMKRMVWSALLLLGSAAWLGAQTTAGRIVGTVFDRTSAAIAGAKLVATNVETGLRRWAESGAEGQYVLYPLAPGVYELEVRAGGFKTEILQGMRIDVAATVTRNIHLELGPVEQQVTVSAEVAPMLTQGISVESTIVREQIEALPLNGRNFNQLVLLAAVLLAGLFLWRRPRAWALTVFAFTMHIVEDYVTVGWNQYPWRPFSPAAVNLADHLPGWVVQGVFQAAAMVFILGTTVWIYLRHGRTPLEVLSPGLDRLVVNYAVLPWRSRCGHCLRRAQFRCDRCGQTVCTSHGRVKSSCEVRCVNCAAG